MNSKNVQVDNTWARFLWRNCPPFWWIGGWWRRNPSYMQVLWQGKGAKWSESASSASASLYNWEAGLFLDRFTTVKNVFDISKYMLSFSTEEWYFHAFVWMKDFPLIELIDFLLWLDKIWISDILGVFLFLPLN